MLLKIKLALQRKLKMLSQNIEIDMKYYLQYLLNSDCLDPIRIDNVKVLKHDFLSKASGYNSI